MKKKLVKIFILVISLVILLVLFLVMNKNNDTDTIKYDGKNYVLLEYNMDVFTYNHNSNSYYEEDIIHPISHNKWDVVYFNGDLFVLKNEISDAEKYYANDKNYDWYIVFDNEDEMIKKSVSISEKERSDLYNLETAKKSRTITFNDIDMFADILKVSKDGLVQAVIVLAQVDNDWYYKTEIITDDDKEYVVKISDSLNNKINDLMRK